MLKALRLGSNDVARSRKFYDATFDALDIEPSAMPPESHILVYKLPGDMRFLCGPALDGQPVTHANGGTVIFGAASEDAVKAWHAAGLANGGSNEGEPEPKARAGGAFGAYIRDPDGNKLAAYAGLNMG